MRRLGLLGCVMLLGLGASCANSDDDSGTTAGGGENGGATTGGATTGGEQTGGASSGDTEDAGASSGDVSGGATTGGATTGGATTGGATTGGAATGGASGGSATGGATMGGTPTGGATTGGATTGGATTGGTTTGGVTTGGATTGGTQSGGAPSGGATTGGTPSGGNTTGGTTIAGAENGGASSGGAGGGDGGTATAGAAGAGGADAAGFDIRIPETRTVECDDGIDATFADADTLCTFSDGTVTGEIYVQASAVSCRMLNSAVPTYEGFAQIMIDGIVTPLSGARYDSGGGHNNDSFDFAYGNTTYRYYHSSFNVGWRRCQPMDCVQLIPSIGALPNEVLDDGCTCERTRPIVCSQIRADGTYAPLDVDRFAVCPYDTTCGG